MAQDTGLTEVKDFNPRSSCEERLGTYTSAALPLTFQSTLLMRGATVSRPMAVARVELISIHAPHARSDLEISVALRIDDTISIHAPHARSDYFLSARSGSTILFQSTLLMRGATRDWLTLCRVQGTFQSTLLMRGATDELPVRESSHTISIHAPHARSDGQSSGL